VRSVEGFIGGRPVALAGEYGKTTTGVWRHPGDHPAFEAHVRTGLLADGRWWVQQTNMPSVSFAFTEEKWAELAVVELLARREGWLRQL
jgi:hypothetical protein